MVLSFLLIPSILKSNSFGWSELSPLTYPKPEFYQTPGKDAQLAFWQFSFVNISFFTLPHLMQRVYAARDLKTLRFAWGVLNAGTFCRSGCGMNVHFLSAAFALTASSCSCQAHGMSSKCRDPRLNGFLHLCLTDCLRPLQDILLRKHLYGYSWCRIAAWRGSRVAICQYLGSNHEFWRFCRSCGHYRLYC